jgi:hypothetical protein
MMMTMSVRRLTEGWLQMAATHLHISKKVVCSNDLVYPVYSVNNVVG